MRPEGGGADRRGTGRRWFASCRPGALSARHDLHDRDVCRAPAARRDPLRDCGAGRGRSKMDGRSSGVHPDPAPGTASRMVDAPARGRGRRCGTIECALERRRVADLLPEHGVATLTEWARRRPSIQVVARDRAGRPGSRTPVGVEGSRAAPPCRGQGVVDLCEEAARRPPAPPLAGVPARRRRAASSAAPRRRSSSAATSRRRDRPALSDRRGARAAGGVCGRARRMLGHREARGAVPAGVVEHEHDDAVAPGARLAGEEGQYVLDVALGDGGSARRRARLAWESASRSAGVTAARKARATASSIGAAPNGSGSRPRRRRAGSSAALGAHRGPPPSGSSPSPRCPRGDLPTRTDRRRCSGPTTPRSSAARSSSAAPSR